MKNKLSYFLIMSMCIMGYAQEIHDLPNSINSAPAYNTSISTVRQQVEEAFNKYHEFSNDLYMAKKLKTTINPEVVENIHQWNESMLSTERWPEGSWGKGHFSAELENRRADQRYRHEDFNYWFNVTNNESKFRGAHPRYFDSSRRLIGYIRKYQSGDQQAEYITKIKAAINYLIAEQITTPGPQFGGYRLDFSRLSQTNTTPFPENAEIITTCTNLVALTEGYTFLNDLNDSSLNTALLKSMKLAGDFLLSSYADVQYSIQPINGEFWAAWSLSCLYEVTRDKGYLAKSITLVKEHIVTNPKQRQDGSWKSKLDETDNYVWHDSEAGYHGIILRGIAKLYNTLPESYTFRTTLKQSMINSINHIIDYNGVTTLSANTQEKWNNYANINNVDDIQTRLRPDGQFYVYHRNDSNHINNSNPLVFDSGILQDTDAKFIIQSLLIAKEAFTGNDKAKIEKMIIGLTYLSSSYISIVRNYADPSTGMMTCGMYVHDDCNCTLNHTTNIIFHDSNSKLTELFKISNVNSAYLLSGTTPNGSPFTSMTTGDFNADGIEEIAFYQPYTGQVSIRNSTDLSWVGTINTRYNFSLPKITFNLMATIDYDGDGKDEIVLHNSIQKLTRIYKMGNSGITHLVSQITPNGTPFAHMTTGDYNGDGREEIAFYQPDTGEVSIRKPSDLSWMGTIRTKSITNNREFDLVSTVDYNNDGKDEIVFHNSTEKLTQIFEMGNTNSAYLVSKTTLNGTAFTNMTVGDFNNDGKEEIALYQLASGEVSIRNAQTINWVGTITTKQGYPNKVFNLMAAIKTNNHIPLASTRAVARLQTNKTTLMDKIILYPNPVHSNLTIHHQFRETDQVVTTIYNVQGQQLQQFKLENSVTEFSLEHLNQGVYFINFIVNGKIQYTKKITKM